MSYVPKTAYVDAGPSGDTMAGDLTISTVTPDIYLSATDATGASYVRAHTDQNGGLQMRSQSQLTRWIIAKDTEAAGGDLRIWRYNNDTNTLTDMPLTIKRSTGEVIMTAPPRRLFTRPSALTVPTGSTPVGIGTGQASMAGDSGDACGITYSSGVFTIGTDMYIGANFEVCWVFSATGYRQVQLDVGSISHTNVISAVTAGSGYTSQQVIVPVAWAPAGTTVTPKLAQTSGGSLTVAANLLFASVWKVGI